MKRLIAPALAPLALLAACDAKTKAPAAPPAPSETRTVAKPASAPPAPAAVAPFQHDPKVELAGYYDTDTIRTGKWELTLLNIGERSDFAAWEAGKRPENYGPIFLEFDDVTSPMAENELGQTYHKISIRVMPDSYSFDGKQVLFRAKDPRLGDVVLDVSPDLAAYKTALAVAPDGGDAPPVFKGSLQIGAKRFRNLSFFYEPGD